MPREKPLGASANWAGALALGSHEACWLWMRLLLLSQYWCEKQKLLVSTCESRWLCARWGLRGGHSHIPECVWEKC